MFKGQVPVIGINKFLCASNKLMCASIQAMFFIKIITVLKCIIELLRIQFI